MCLGAHWSFFDETFIGFNVVNLNKYLLPSRALSFTAEQLQNPLAYLSGVYHVLMYQNVVANLSQGGNAMVFFIPSGTPLNADYIVDTSKCPNILNNMYKAVYPEPKSSMRIELMGPGEYSIAKHGIYESIITRNPSLIPDILARGEISRNKVPSLPTWLPEFYSRVRPGWDIVFSCFDNRDRKEADPIMIVYPPIDPNQVFFPAYDNPSEQNDGTHNGPPTNAQVYREQTLLFGTYLMDRYPQIGKPVHYTDRISNDILQLLPKKVIGYRMNDEYTPNGDFTAAQNNILSTGKLNLKVLQ